MNVRWMVAPIAALLLATACGDAEIPPEVALQVDRAEELDAIDFETGLSAAEERCLNETAGEELVRDVVYDGTEVGNTARTRFTQAIIDCLDDPAAWPGLVEATRLNLERTAGVPVELSAGEVECYLRGFVERAEDPARTIAVGDTADAVELAFTLRDECFTPENIALLTGEDSPFRVYGDDPDLDDLHDRCGEGDLAACDLLWFMSGVDTEYEDFAATCGGTTAGDDWCTGMILGSDGFALETDPGLRRLLDACEERDFISCDLAYAISPIGSEAESEAFRCGGAMITGSFGNCRDIDRDE